MCHFSIYEVENKSENKYRKLLNFKNCIWYPSMINTCIQKQRLFLHVMDIFDKHIILGLQYFKQNDLSVGSNPHNPPIQVVKILLYFIYFSVI